MGKEINLLSNYPKSKRDITYRAKNKNENVRTIARKFGKEFFDGSRDYGYGGFNYNPKFWTKVVRDFKDFYNLKNNAKILDVGCAKGFMLHDFKLLNENFQIYGIDISEYAIKNCHPSVKDFVKIGNAKKIDYPDNYFDLVISINSVHNLDFENCKKALKEIQRVSKKNSFITVDAFRSQEEKEAMFDWNLTAQTILSVDDWIKLFKEIGYNGDYYWFIP